MATACIAHAPAIRLCIQFALCYILFIDEVIAFITFAHGTFALTACTIRPSGSFCTILFNFTTIIYGIFFTFCVIILFIQMISIHTRFWPTIGVITWCHALHGRRTLGLVVIAVRFAIATVQRIGFRIDAGVSAQRFIVFTFRATCAARADIVARALVTILTAAIHGILYTRVAGKVISRIACGRTAHATFA